MLSYIFGLLLLRKFGLPKPLRYAILTLFAGLVLVVLIYTIHLFATLPERTSGHHVQPHSSR
jgi:hypothetical protein